MLKPLRIFLVEDSPGLLDELAQVLQEQTGIEVLGRTFSGEKAVTEIQESHPDLVLMDWDDNMTGAITLVALKALLNPPAVIVLAAAHDHPHFRAAVKALGAQASLPRRMVHSVLKELSDVQGNPSRLGA